jgi:hypothetical protein
LFVCLYACSRSTSEGNTYGKQRICFSNVSWLSDFIFYHKPLYKSLHQSFFYSFINILPSESGVTLHYSTILPYCSWCWKMFEISGSYLPLRVCDLCQSCQTWPAKFGQIWPRTDTSLVFCNRKLMRTDILFTRTTKHTCNFAHSEFVSMYTIVMIIKSDACQLIHYYLYLPMSYNIICNYLFC